MNNPEYAKIGDKKYKINTDFMVGIECDAIARDTSIGEYERALAIIYKVFGDEGLNDTDNHIKLLELAEKYLSCGQKVESKKNLKPDIDFKHDFMLIKTSFRSDYGIILENEKMHWWDFYWLLNGLSNSELGNSCILNRIRDIRNRDPKDEKDKKTREALIEAKKIWDLPQKKKKPTQKQLESIENLKRIIGRK